MTPLPFEKFDAVYQDAVETVFAHWTDAMQSLIAAHCHSWGPGLFDFKGYLRASTIRFYKAYRSFASRATAEEQQSVCDVGGFWGVFPLTLKALGYRDVTMTESLKYYGDSFKGLFECIGERGVKIFDFDPFEPHQSLAERFDVITVMAVLEHYPHSLRNFMENVISIMKPDGRIYLEVPNIAYWPKRTGLLLGRTPLAQLSDIFRSDVPFIGHHHEFTIAELRDLARLSGLSVIQEDFYNYTLGVSPGLKMLLRHPINFLAFTFSKESRECLAILCKLKDGPDAL